MNGDVRGITAPMSDCWRLIGVSGDRSCRELERFIHCRNCPVLAEAARAFFDRPAPEGYLESWREVLARPEETADPAATSVLVFRVGTEWLALPASILVEVTTPRRLHRLPHPRGSVVEGLVNIRGQLQLCGNLRGLLAVDDQPASPQSDHEPRLLVVDRDGDRWVFRVDEVSGVHRLTKTGLRAAPSTVSVGPRPMVTGLFDALGRTVALIDDAQLYAGLHDRMLE